MRVAFAGTPAIAARALEAILAAGHSVPLVLTRPDRPAGRGLRLAQSEVARVAERQGLAVLKPSTLNADDVRKALEGAHCDAMVVAAFGMVLPPAVLSLPRRGCINIHASLLPRWRGAAPIQRAILAGDARTGITIMRMDEGLDTGPALLQRAVEISARDTAGSLLEALSGLGAACIVEALARLGELHPIEQDSSLATYAAKIAKAEARIDWSRTGDEIGRQVRAFNPVPGAETRLEGQALKIWEAEPSAGQGEPGVVLQADAVHGIVVACGAGALRLKSLQRAGGRRLSAEAFLPGARLATGQKLDSAPGPVAANPLG